VQIRSLAAQAVIPKDYDYELPFLISVDGPYFSVEDFFSRLSRLSRIINVGDLSFTGLADSSKSKYPLRPGSTVTGSCTVTTFFSKPTEEIMAAGKKPPAKK
jgi:Tfp pilus assembly protein PilO